MVAIIKDQHIEYYEDLPIDQVIHSDCVDVLRKLPPNSIDAIVCDPPANLSFMGAKWDTFGHRDNFIAFMTDVFTEGLRVCRPGAHAFVWALPKCSHWTGMALENAGWEVRDCITHLFGQGFPKSMSLRSIGHPELGTALKPAAEFWWLVRKPLSESTVAQNVLTWGCGGLNIDQCRVSAQGDILGRNNKPGENGWKNSSGGPSRAMSDPVAASKRFPSNLLLSHDPRCLARGTKRVRSESGGPHKEGKKREGSVTWHIPEYTADRPYHDEHGLEEVPAFECHPSCPVRVLGEQAGRSKSRPSDRNTEESHSNIYGWAKGGIHKSGVHFEDEGTAARYFTQFHDPLSSLEAPFHYFSKASKSDRNKGLEGMPTSASSRNGKMNGTSEHTPKYDTPEQNDHPTVKSLALCRWLCRLVGVPGGVILDPFAGSGSTLCAAIQEGFHFIGIEQDAHYCDIARARIAHAQQEARREESEGQEYICVEECPVYVLGKQSGVSVSKAAPRGGTSPNPMSWGEKRRDGEKMAGHSDVGTAARFFTQFPPEPVSLWDEEVAE